MIRELIRHKQRPHGVPENFEMSICYIPVVFVVLFDLLYISCAITHWIVSKEGNIQAQYDSIYLLKRPYDLVAFLNQEKLAKNVASHFNEMLQRKAEMDMKWSGISSASESEQQLVTFDEDCIQARNTDQDGDLYMNIIDYASHNLHSKEWLPDDNKIQGNVNLDCRTYSELDFSMSTFPHLQVMYHPWNLTWPKETEINLPLTVKQIHYGLNMNKTNWYLYNLASLYWRREGNIQNAFYCIKRAIHFSPRQYKDTPLFNFGVMLHRARCTAEAAILLHGAIDYAPHKPFGHLILANVYATLGDFNRSIACYNNALGIDPNWIVAKAMRHSLICHTKVRQKLEDLQRSILDILKQLKDFQTLQDEWLKFYEEILRQQATTNRSFTGLLTAQSEKTPKGSCETGKDEMQILSCQLKPNFNFGGLQMDGDLESLYNLFSTVELQAQKICEKIICPPTEGNHHPASTEGNNEEDFIPFHWNSDIDHLSTLNTNEY